MNMSWPFTEAFQQVRFLTSTGLNHVAYGGILSTDRMKEFRMKKFESTEEAEVAYENLRCSFDVMMKQYKGLEEEIGSLKLQNFVT